MSGIKIVFGGGPIQSNRAFGTVEILQEVFKILKDGGVTTIDTARVYGESEDLLGAAHAGDHFIIDTKAPGVMAPGSVTRDGIAKVAAESLSKLGLDQVDVYYLHSHDESVPLEDTLAGINDVYKRGMFKRFGLSNYHAPDVQKVYDHCKEKGYPLPTVYQGNYNPVARKQEELLFPTLRKLGIAFYAYSPLAGGFLTKTKQQVLDGAGRFDPSDFLGKMYSSMYARPSYLDALSQWHAIAKEEGCSTAALAYRWVRYNSPLSPEHGDALIVGSRSIEQLKETLEDANAGPLSKKAVEGIDQIWKTIEHEAPLDNFHY
ncbi:hypothetical protein M8818_002777 [Zalaria obscura]|uniref:Uncharacterized protein n=1 Tax=Zalaria obscura TaxID=2024903 RepID=A0ACC3SHW1_9PEZI